MQTMARTVRAAPPPLLSRNALFLDFDGTLAAIAERPDQVQVAPSLVPLLQALLVKLDHAVAIVSGRPLAEVDDYLRPLWLAGAGQHGGELRHVEDGEVKRRRHPAVAAAAAELRARYGEEPALLLEDKGASVALHFRQAPSRSGECVAAVERVAHRHGLDLLLGRMVAEARPHGQDKGSAIAALLGHAPFAGRVPVFVGDDRTDEDGFLLVRQRGGHGIRVGAGNSVAEYRLPDVDAVHRWLASAVSVAATAERS